MSLTAAVEFYLLGLVDQSFPVLGSGVPEIAQIRNLLSREKVPVDPHWNWNAGEPQNWFRMGREGDPAAAAGVGVPGARVGAVNESAVALLAAFGSDGKEACQAASRQLLPQSLLVRAAATAGSPIGG